MRDTGPRTPLASRSPGAGLERWEGCTSEELQRSWKLPLVVLRSRVGSTNDVARTFATAGAPIASLVLAEEQLAGRGRAGRVWHSPPGLGLWCSFLAAPPGMEHLGAVPLRVGLSVAIALERWVPAGVVRIKWPNDLLLGEKKLGGILCETSSAGTAISRLVIGIGLNLLQREEDFPPEIRARATSLRLAAGVAVSRYEVAAAIVDQLRPIVAGTGPSTLDIGEFARRDALVGRRLEVRDPVTGRTIAAGTACGIDGRGALRLETDRGVVPVHTGSVVESGVAP